MAFDKSLDKELFSESKEFEVTKLTVSVHSYNEGTPKVQVSRENRNMDSGDFKWSKLGRMTKEEAEAVIPLLTKALDSM
ncbi:hypothetical protein K9M79_04690 [Candidatus Woesearchaeota archaeon]|nr:hypothetical protein [Candidatus Woesearchaeota archaeon]